MSISTPKTLHATLTFKTVAGDEMSVVMDMVNAEVAGDMLEFDSRILQQLRNYDLITGDGDHLDLDDAARVVEELRATMRPFVGTPILISAAAETYGFTAAVIYKWIAAKWVKILTQEPLVLVDEGDIALAKALADKRGHTAGRSVFPAKPRSGRPRKNR